MPKAKIEAAEGIVSQFAGLTPGRIVHYVDLDGNHRAAAVTAVTDPESGHVNLFVFPDGEQPYDLPNGANPVNVMYDGEGKARRSWHWIEAA